MPLNFERAIAGWYKVENEVESGLDYVRKAKTQWVKLLLLLQFSATFINGSLDSWLWLRFTLAKGYSRLQLRQ
jgi:hypothetical protein